MSNLRIFRSAFVDKLRTAAQKNLPLYQSDSIWVNSVGSAGERELPTSLALRSDLDLIIPEAGASAQVRAEKDLDNAVRLHKALPQLTRLQARDPRLWSRLGHVDLWIYMRRRWPIDAYVKSDGEKVAAGRISERYFIPQSQSRALMRNGVSRLWWAAALTRDESRENPYELTAVLFSNLDITQTILERAMGRAEGVRLGFLEFLLKQKDTLLSGGDKNRIRIRALGKFLNLHGGVCVLDCLRKEQVMDKLQAEFDSLL